MIKKSVDYVDFNGNKKTKDVYFHLSLSEAIELKSDQEVKKILELSNNITDDNIVQVLKVFKKVILSAYGEKSEDGESFIKTEENRKTFENSAVYAEVFKLIATNPEESEKFMNSIIPEDLKNQQTDNSNI